MSECVIRYTIECDDSPVQEGAKRANAALDTIDKKSEEVTKSVAASSKSMASDMVGSVQKVEGGFITSLKHVEAAITSASSSFHTFATEIKKISQDLYQGLKDTGDLAGKIYRIYETAKTVVFIGDKLHEKIPWDQVKERVKNLKDWYDNLKLVKSAFEGLGEFLPELATAGIGIATQRLIELVNVRGKLIEQEAIFAATHGDVSFQNVQRGDIIAQIAGNDKNIYRTLNTGLAGRVETQQSDVRQGLDLLNVSRSLGQTGKEISPQLLKEIAIGFNNVQSASDRAKAAVLIFKENAALALNELGPEFVRRSKAVDYYGLGLDDETNAKIFHLRQQLRGLKADIDNIVNFDWLKESSLQLTQWTDKKLVDVATYLENLSRIGNQPGAKKEFGEAVVRVLSGNFNRPLNKAEKAIVADYDKELPLEGNGRELVYGSSTFFNYLGYGVRSFGGHMAHGDLTFRKTDSQVGVRPPDIDPESDLAKFDAGVFGDKGTINSQKAKLTDDSLKSSADALVKQAYVSESISQSTLEGQQELLSAARARMSQALAKLHEDDTVREVFKTEENLKAKEEKQGADTIAFKIRTAVPTPNDPNNTGTSVGNPYQAVYASAPKPVSKPDPILLSQQERIELAAQATSAGESIKVLEGKIKEAKAGSEAAKHQIEALRASQEILSSGDVSAGKDIRKEIERATTYQDDKGDIQHVILLDETRRNLDHAFRIYLHSLQEKDASDNIKAEEEDFQRRTAYEQKLFEKRYEYALKTLELETATSDKLFAHENELAGYRRDERLGALGILNPQTIEGKLALEQRKLSVQQDFITSTSVNDQEAITRDRDRAVNEARDYLFNQPVTNPNGAVNSADLARDFRTYQDRKSAIERSAAQQASVVSDKFNHDNIAAQQEAAKASIEIVRDAQTKEFESLRSTVEGVLNSIETKGTNVFAAIANSAKVSLIAAFNQVVTNKIAAQLFEMFNPGQTVQFDSSFAKGKFGALGVGNPVFGGTSPADILSGGLPTALHRVADALVSRYSPGPDGPVHGSDRSMSLSQRKSPSGTPEFVMSPDLFDGILQDTPGTDAETLKYSDVKLLASKTPVIADALAAMKDYAGPATFYRGERKANDKTVQAHERFHIGQLQASGDNAHPFSDEEFANIFGFDKSTMSRAKEAYGEETYQSEVPAYIFERSPKGNASYLFQQYYGAMKGKYPDTAFRLLENASPELRRAIPNALRREESGDTAVSKYDQVPLVTDFGASSVEQKGAQALEVQSGSESLGVPSGFGFGTPLTNWRNAAVPGLGGFWKTIMGNERPGTDSHGFPGGGGGASKDGPTSFISRLLFGSSKGAGQSKTGFYGVDQSEITGEELPLPNGFGVPFGKEKAAGMAAGLSGSLKNAANSGWQFIGNAFHPGNTATFGQNLSQLGHSPAALVGGGLLVADGVRRGGFAGTLEDTAGGAAIGFKYGGPEGAAIGAAVGLTVGVLRQTVWKTLWQQVKERVKSEYHLNINNETAQEIANLAKTQYGGSIAVALHSQQVMQMLGLYAETTGQKFGLTGPQAAHLAFSGGQLEQAGTYVNGSLLGFESGLKSLNPFAGIIQSPTYDKYGQLPSQVVSTGQSNPMQVSLSLDGDSSAAFLQGQTVNAMNTTAGQQAVSDAQLASSSASYNRLQQLARLTSPSTVIA